MALTTNQVSYWKLDGNSNDAVSTNNGTDTSVTYTTGKINNGASFNGSSSFISIPSVTALQITGALTISAWIKITSLTGGGRIVCKSNGDVSNYEFEFGYGSSGDLNFTSSNSSNYFNCSSSTGLIGTGSWIHVAVVKTGSASGDTVTFYVNGVASTTTFNSSNPSFVATSSTAVTIGKRTNGGSPIFLNGMVDETGIWSRALISTEITQLYNGGTGIQYPYGTAYILALIKGAYSYAGQVVILKSNRIISIVKGTYSLLGKNLLFGLGKGIVIVRGLYNYTGQSINLKRNRIIAIIKGSYAYTGFATILRKGKSFTIGTGYYTLRGLPLRFQILINRYIKNVSLWRNKDKTNN